MAELLYIVDENDEPLKPVERATALSAGLWRRAAGAMIIDHAKGLVLCHRRSLQKDERPGLWVSTFGGKCNAGEEPVIGASREVSEEIGLEVLPKDLTWFGKHKSTERIQYEYAYFLYVKSADFIYSVDKTEVIDTQWCSFFDVKSHLKTSKDWCYYGYEIEMIDTAIRASD